MSGWRRAAIRPSHPSTQVRRALEIASRRHVNVVAVNSTASPPTITIGNRDGVVVLVWVGPRDQLPAVQVGDYVQADGEKVNEQRYEITDISVD
jgi:hypothetical protein